MENVYDGWWIKFMIDDGERWWRMVDIVYDGWWIKFMMDKFEDGLSSWWMKDKIDDKWWIKCLMDNGCWINWMMPDG